MAIDYPLYEISSGKREGIHQFLFVSETEYNLLGETRAKEIEYGRIRSWRISTNPEARRKFSERRTHRRATEPGLREREVEQRRNRRRKLTSS